MPTAGDTASHRPAAGGESVPPRYASFILRCWKNDAGQTSARLFDIRSGVSRPVANLAELPGLVRHLMTEALVDPPKHAEDFSGRPKAARSQHCTKGGCREP